MQPSHSVEHPCTSLIHRDLYWLTKCIFAVIKWITKFFFINRSHIYLDVLNISALPYLQIPPLETCKHKSHQVEMQSGRAKQFWFVTQYPDFVEAVKFWQAASADFCPLGLGQGCFLPGMHPPTLLICTTGDSLSISLPFTQIISAKLTKQVWMRTSSFNTTKIKQSAGLTPTGFMCLLCEVVVNATSLDLDLHISSAASYSLIPLLSLLIGEKENK